MFHVCIGCDGSMCLCVYVSVCLCVCVSVCLCVCNFSQQHSYTFHEMYNIPIHFMLYVHTRHVTYHAPYSTYIPYYIFHITYSTYTFSTYSTYTFSTFHVPHTSNTIFHIHSILPIPRYIFHIHIPYPKFHIPRTFFTFHVPHTSHIPYFTYFHITYYRREESRGCRIFCFCHTHFILHITGGRRVWCCVFFFSALIVVGTFFC